MFKNAAGIFVLTMAVTGSAWAADFSGAPVYRSYGAVCANPKVPSVMSLPTIQEMANEITARYVSAAQTSEMESVQASRTTRYQWALQARAACGIALGYLSTNEVNPDRLWNCECYYERMGGPVISVRY